VQPKPEITYWIVQYDAAGGRNLTSSSLMTVGAVRDQLKWLVEAKHATNLRVREYVMVTTSRDVTDAFAVITAAVNGSRMAETVPLDRVVLQPGDTVQIVGGVEVHDA
jgi:hypothetical protein